MGRMTENHRSFRAKLDEITREYTISLAGPNMTVRFAKTAHYKIFIERFAGKIPFHTYTPKEERTTAFVTAGIGYSRP